MRGKLELVEGVPISDVITRDWQQIKNFDARPGDILIDTYPKSGTTWMQEIVDLILNNGDEAICRRGAIFERVPFIELMCAMKPVLTSASHHSVTFSPSTQVSQFTPSAQCHHHPLIPASSSPLHRSVIYVARNARDTVTSFYHFEHMALIHPEPGTFEEYLERFMIGDVGWGSWYDHVKGFWEQKSQRNILYLFYEDLKRVRNIKISFVSDRL
ncbi:sulfotransferase 1 family member D1-like isoform X1 [Pelobates cultripes]|uniref:Sulfotransferase n=1 Tax=Pelobates cultripes TaxID=61616 RepID=A0AAD1WPC1_PELCU|nr:sulfotransferase 1 family member D1-like isoform X1 [Pelobates cultripes]